VGHGGAVDLHQDVVRQVVGEVEEAGLLERCPIRLGGHRFQQRVGEAPGSRHQPVGAVEQGELALIGGGCRWGVETGELFLQPQPQACRRTAAGHAGASALFRRGDEKRELRPDPGALGAAGER
jgi:hypothetical protein